MEEVIVVSQLHTSIIYTVFFYFVSRFNDKPNNRIIIHSINVLDGYLTATKMREMFHDRIISKATRENGYVDTHTTFSFLLHFS